MNCFTSDAARDQFWAGTYDPLHEGPRRRPTSARSLELARRCGQVNGDLLDHISTADTTRDLDALRGMVGDDLLTYVGLSYGTVIGQTYINLFPKRIRAMVLDGIVDPVTVHEERRDSGRQPGRGAFDAVFSTFLELCESAGAGHCALAGHGETVAQRVARVFATAKRSLDPGAALRPARRPRLCRLDSRRLQPAQDPSRLGRLRRGPQCCGGGRRISNWRTWRALSGPRLVFAGATTSSCDLVPRRSGPQTLPVLAQCHPEVHRRRARSTDRCWGGGCGHRARRTGRGRVTIGMPARGAPSPRRRSS